MLKAGVIVSAPVDIEYQSACFVVPKRDGKKRIVVDMRKANEQLEDDFVPSKPVTHMLAGPQVFSSVDVQHAFFSLELEPGTQDATAFYADSGSALRSEGGNLSGKYIFDRCVMGAQASSAALFKAMTFALRKMPNVIIYGDDLFIQRVEGKSHLQSINQLFEKLGRWGFKIAPRKCKFFHQTLNFLGYSVSGKGIKPEYDKMVYLKGIAPPKDNKQIRSSLGFVNFFHKFPLFLSPRRVLTY